MSEQKTVVEQFDIVICGAGLVGLTLANCLHDSSLSVAVIDAQSAPAALADNNLHDASQNKESEEFQLDSGYAPRVSAINLKSSRLLARFDIWQQLQRAQPLRAMHIWDGMGTSDLAFSAADINENQLGYIVENQQVISALQQRLKASENITLMWQTKLEDICQEADGYELELSENRIIECSLLVGADGGNSRIRTLANFKKLNWQYGQTALVTTIRTEQAHDGVARQWFTDEGPLAFLPLADPNLCSIVWSLQDAETYKTETEADFCRRLSAASEGQLGQVTGVDARFSFPLVQQHALGYVKPHLALIGDAAHTIHPLAGQGANLGFADAAELAQVLLEAAYQGKAPGELEVLRQFERARIPHNAAMTSLMELFKRLYTSQNPAVNWLRNKTMGLINQQDMLKILATKLASGLL